MSVAGIDLGGTKLAAAAFSDAGDVLHRRQALAQETSAAGDQYLHRPPPAR